MFGFFDQAKEIYDDFEREVLPLMQDVYRVAFWLSRDQSDAEDLTQETFTQAYMSFHRYEKGTNCKAWIMTILHRTNIKRLRKKTRIKTIDDPEEQIASTIAFEPSIPQHITDEDYLEALKRVPAQFRSVVLMADVEEFAYKEVAQMLEIPIGTVMSRLHRGRKLLRLELAVHARAYGIGLKGRAAEK